MAGETRIGAPIHMSLVATQDNSFVYLPPKSFYHDVYEKSEQPGWYAAYHKAEQKQKITVSAFFPNCKPLE